MEPIPPPLIVALLLGAAVILRFAVKRAIYALVPRALRFPRTFAGSRGGRIVERLHARLARRAPRLAAFLRDRVDPSHFRGLPLSVIVVNAGILALLFSEISEGVLEGEELLALDRWLLAALEPLRVEPFLRPFIWVTELGDTTTLVMAALVGSGFLWVERRGHLVIGLWVTVVGSQAMLWIGKLGFARVRPEFLTEATAVSPSFPSGHTTGAMAIYGYLAFAIARLAPHAGVRFELGFWAALLIFLVGFSRVYLHVHYPSDVAAGLLTGALWLLLGAAVAEWYRREAPPQALGPGA